MQNIEQPEDEESRSRPISEGWRTEVSVPSLSEVFRTIRVPQQGSFWKRLLAFAGPGYLIAVGYMDPGNWATDIAGGAQFAYALLSVVLLSNFLAMFLQALSAKLGIVTGRDLAQACRDAYPRPISLMLWISAEIAIIACDIAEVLGAAIALNLLFNIPLIWGVIITTADVLLVLAFQHKGFRWIESMVIALIATMMGIFAIELVFSHPAWGPVAQGFIPSSRIVLNHQALYISLGIMGATVMPHNLYLHSAIVQTRQYRFTAAGIADAIKMSIVDSTVALSLAFLVNAAILVLAASTFYQAGHHQVDEIARAYEMLTPIMGVSFAAPLFAVALLASGQNSTLTGTMAGQVVLEGFTHFRIPPWIRRVISRGIAIVPAIGAIWLYGERGLAGLMIFSQVVLSAQLAFAVVPLVHFTSDAKKMGRFVNNQGVRYLGWTMAGVIAVLNAYLIVTQLTKA